jgi:hypothetical protein
VSSPGSSTPCARCGDFVDAKRPDRAADDGALCPTCRPKARIHGPAYVTIVGTLLGPWVGPAIAAVSHARLGQPRPAITLALTSLAAAAGLVFLLREPTWSPFATLSISFVIASMAGGTLRAGDQRHQELGGERASAVWPVIGGIAGALVLAAVSLLLPE